MTEDTVRPKLDKGVVSFFESDRALLESGVREDSVAHKLANHVSAQFDGLDVDAEYDKMHIDGIPYVPSLLTEWRTSHAPAHYVMTALDLLEFGNRRQHIFLHEPRSNISGER